MSFNVGDFIEEIEDSSELHIITDTDVKKGIYLVDNKEWYSEKDLTTIYKKSVAVTDNIKRLQKLVEALPKYGKSW